MTPTLRHYRRIARLRQRSILLESHLESFISVSLEEPMATQAHPRSLQQVDSVEMESGSRPLIGEQLW